MLSAIILAVLTAIAYSSGSHLADDRSRRPTSDRHLSDHNRHLPAPHNQYPVNTRHVLGGPKHFPYTEEDLADSRKLSVDRADSKLPGDDYNSRSAYNGHAQQASTSAFEDQTGNSFEYYYDQPSMDRFDPTKDYSAAVFDYPEDGQFSFAHSADVDTVSKVDSKREATIDLNENDPSRYSSEKYDGQVDISPEQLRAKDKLQPVRKPGPFISPSYNPDTDVQTTEDQTTEDQTTEDQTTEDQTTEDQTTEDQTTEDQTTEDQNTEDQNTEDHTQRQDEPKSLLESRLDQMNRLMSGNSQNTFSGKGKASGLPMDVLHELELIGGPYASLLNEDSLHEALGSNSMSKTYQPVTSNKQAEKQTGVVLDKPLPGEGNQTGDRSEGNHTMPRSVLNQTYFEDQHGLDDSNETLAVEHCGKNCKNRSKQDEAHAPTNHLGDAQTVGEQSDYDGDNGTSREGLAGFLQDDKNSSTTYSKNVNQDLSDKSVVQNTRSVKNSSKDIYPLDSSRDQVNLTEFRIASDVDAQPKGNGSSDSQNQSDYERSKPYDHTSLHHIQNHSGKDQFGKTFFQFGNDTENDSEDQENQSVGSEDQDDKLESESQEDDEHNESENGDDVGDKPTKSRHGNGRLSEVSKVSNTVLSANENHVNNENKETEHLDLLRDQGDLDINSGEVDSADNDPKHKDEYYRKRLEELIRKRLDTVIPEAIDQLDEEALASAFSRKPASQKNKSTRATEIKTVRYAARKFENLNSEENSSESRVLHDYLQEFVHKFHAMIKDVRGNKVIIFQEANSTDNTNKTGVFPFERAVKSEKGNGDFNIDKNETHTEQQLNETGITFSNNETKSSGQMLNDGNHNNSSSEANNQKGQLDQNSFLNHTGTNSSTAGNTSGIASNESQNETRNSLSTETPAGSSRAAFGELNDTAADQSGNSSSKFEKTSDRLEEELDRFKTHHAQFKNKTDNEIGNKTDNEINTTDHESGKNHSVGNKTYDQFTNNRADYHEHKTTDEPDNEKLNRSEISDKPSTSDILDVSPFDKNDKAMDSSESGLQEGLYSIFSAETVMKTHGYFPGSHGDKTVKKPSYKPYDRFDYSTHDSGLGPSGYQSHQSGDDHQRMKNLRKQSTWFSPNDVFRPAGSSHNKIYPSGYKVPQSHEVVDRPGYDPERAFGYKFKGSGNPFQTADGYSNSRTSRGLVDKANKRSTAFDPRYYKLYPQQGYQPRVGPDDLVYGNPVKAAYGPSYSYNDVRYYKGRRPSYRSYPPVQVVFTPNKRAYEPSQESLSALRAFPYGANHDYTQVADFSSKGAYGRPVYRTSYGLGGRSGSMPVNFHWRSNRPIGNEGPSYTSYKNPVHGAYAGSVYNRPVRTIYSLAPERDSYTHFKVFNHPPFFQYSPFDYNAPRSHSETPGLSPVVGHGHTPARALGKIRNARDKVPNLSPVSTMPVFQMYTPYDDAGYSKSSDPGFSVDKARHHITPDFKIHSSSGGETPQMDDRVDYSILGSDKDGQKYHQFGKDYLEKIYDRLDPEVIKSVEAILLKFPARKDAEDSERNGLGTATLDQSGETDAEDLSDYGGKLNKTDNILDRPADNGTLELDRKRNSSEVNGTAELDQSQYNTTNSGREMKNDELNGTSTPDMVNATHELRNDSGSQDNRTASLYQPLHKDGQNKTVILSNNPPHSVSNLRRKELFFDSSDMAKVEQFVCPKGSYLSGIQSWVGLDEWSYVRNYRRHFNFSCRTLPNFGAKYETVCLWAGHSRWLKPSSFNCGGQAVITGWRLFHSKMGLDYSMAFLCCFPASPEGEPILTLTQCRLTPHYVNLQHGKINFTMPGSAVLYGVRSDVTYAVDRRFTFEYCQPLPNCSPAQDTATSGQDG